MGRGAVNQKGPETAFLAALHAMRAAGKKPPVNLVLVAEGEEEIASPHFHQVVQHPKVMPAMQKCVGRHHPVGLAGAQRAGDDPARRQGRGGAGADLRLPRSGAAGRRRTCTPAQKARVDSPAWRLVQALHDAGDAGWQHAGDRRLVREGAAADGAPEGADDAQYARIDQRSGGEKASTA